VPRYSAEYKHNRLLILADNVAFGILLKSTLKNARSRRKNTMIDTGRYHAFSNRGMTVNSPVSTSLTCRFMVLSEVGIDRLIMGSGSSDAAM
jgi:hypothetical protein